MLDEYQNNGLLRASFEASRTTDYDTRSRILNNARDRLQASTLDFGRVIQAAADIRKKPIRLDVEVRRAVCSLSCPASYACIHRVCGNGTPNYCLRV